MEDKTIKLHAKGMYMLILLEKHDHKFLHLETYKAPDDCNMLFVDNYIYVGNTDIRFMVIPVNTKTHHPQVEKLKYRLPNKETIESANAVINQFIANNDKSIKRDDLQIGESIKNDGNGVFEVRHGQHIHKCKFNNATQGKNNIVLSFTIDGKKYHLHATKEDIEDVRGIKLPDRDLIRQINTEIKMNLLTYVDEWFLVND